MAAIIPPNIKHSRIARTFTGVKNNRWIYTIKKDETNRMALVNKPVFPVGLIPR
jgi:hypothetical protein